MKVLAVAHCAKRADRQGADCMRPRYWDSMIRFPNVCGVHAPLIFQLQRLDSFAWGPDVSSPMSI
ncbi:hypothetical protein [Agrobacterium tumefaciens]|uniref:hypothetical protein n=1 Tax=Agrobacterium tumefaciens TaxID=358 RepID=UPI002243E187|nr:hypothetical protein [Agrobacterium tumefaciens]MCW8060759.1 hypothetical protein [Agrobacterium tumefaciens]